MADASLATILKIVLDIQARVSALEGGGGGGGGGAAPAAGGGAAEASVSPAVKGYDAFVAAHVTPFVENSKTLGPEGVKLGEFIEAAFHKYTREFLVMASQNKKPAKADDLKAWKDELGVILKAVGAFKDTRSPFANYMSAMAEAVQATNWLFQDLPTPFIENFRDGTTFYTNKILAIKRKEGEAGANHVKWCNQFKDFFTELMAYVKATHTTGVVYNNKGGNTYAKGAGGAAAPAAPVAASTAAPAVAKAAAPTVAKGDIFAGINAIDQSSGKTAGLKKVEKSEMTHKNAALRAGAVVKASEPGKKEAAAKPATLACNNNRWECQYQTEKIEINIESSKQEVYVFGCVGATIVIKGKFKTLTVDGCKKTNIVLDSVISTVEIVNCKAQKIQVLGNAPACAVDKTDGFQIYLSKTSHTTQIVTSKCSDMNANFELDDGEWKECPIPEQFVSNFAAGKLTTTISDLYH